MQINETFPSPALAKFSYAIRIPNREPMLAVIEARAWPTALVPVSGGFDDAIAAAKQIASVPLKDGMHGMPVHQAQGILQSSDGVFSIVPLGGKLMGSDGPVFIDGAFFDASALSMQVVRTTSELVAVVGKERVLDLRQTGSAFVSASPAA